MNDISNIGATNVKHNITVCIDFDVLHAFDDARGLVTRSAAINDLIKEATAGKPPKFVGSDLNTLRQKRNAHE